MLIRAKSGPSNAPPSSLGDINSTSQHPLQHAAASQQYAADKAYDYAPALSPRGHAGDTGIRTRKVAILVGNGIDGPMVRAIYTALLNDGAMPRLVGSKLGKIHANDKSVLYIEITFEDGPPVLYDALVVPDGEAAIASLGRDAHALDFVREQYRHCKPIMAMGAGAQLLRQANVPAPPAEGLAPALAAFKTALASHRAFAREAASPLE